MPNDKPQPTPEELARKREAFEVAAHESAIVGIMLQDPSTIDEIAAVVDPHMFEGLDTRRAFEAVAMLHHAAVSLGDLNTVGARMLSLGVAEDLCTNKALLKLRRDSFAHNRRHHANEIRKSWLKRELEKLGTKAAERASKCQDPEREMAWVESQLDILAAGGCGALETRRAEFIADDVLHEVESPEAMKPGVMCGLYELDEHMGPIMPGELAIIAARPGDGKTSLAMQMAQRVAERGQVLFISLEMRDRELIRRSLSALAAVDSRKLRESSLTESDIDRLRGARHELKGLPLEICAPSRATIHQICGVAKYRKAIGGPLRMIFVDYIGLVRPSNSERGMDRHLQVGEFTAALKSLGKELECPVVALAQLNRDAQNKEPTLANLRESGSIEQDADIVILIHHPADDAKANLIVAKHRHGKRWKVRVKWNPETTSFGEPRIDAYGGVEFQPT